TRSLRSTPTGASDAAARPRRRPPAPGPVLGGALAMTRPELCAGCGLGSEAGAQQVERVDGVAGIGVRLLLDDMPPVADAERRRSHPQPPRQVQAAADPADGGVDDLEVGGVAEPGAEDAAHRVG